MNVSAPRVGRKRARTSPRVFLRGGVFWCDLRPDRPSVFSLGVSVDEPRAAERARELAHEHLGALRARAERAQLALPLRAEPLPDAAERAGSVRAYLRRWLAQAEWRKPRTRDFYASHARAVARDLGALALAELAPPAGRQLLRRWTWAQQGDERRVTREEAAELGGLRKLTAKTIQNRHLTLRRCLKWLRDEGLWLGELPAFPRPNRLGEKIHRVGSAWVPEDRFLVLLDAVEPRARRIAEKAAAGKWAERYRRHRLYLQIAYYTGFRRADVETFAPEHFSTAFGVYEIRSTKTAAADCDEIENQTSTLPPQLLQALRTEEERRGGFAPGVPIVGRWPNVGLRLRQACDRLGWARFDALRAFRRGFCTELAARGVPEHVTVAMMGQKSSRMVRGVYRKIPRAQFDSAAAAWSHPRAIPLPADRPADIRRFPVRGDK